MLGDIFFAVNYLFFPSREYLVLKALSLTCFNLLNFVPLYFQSELLPGNLLRFAVSEGGLNFLDGKLEKADLQYLGKVNRARAFADTYSKVSELHSMLCFEFCYY